MMKRVRFAAAGFAAVIATACVFAAETTGTPGGEAKPPAHEGGAPRVRDDVSQQLRPHQRHVYERDMADCETMARVERQVCQRGVRSKARAKLRRRPH